MQVVLLVDAGAGWEPAALRALSAHPGVVVLKRCVDVDDLLAAATAGQADVAVLGLEAPGLDRHATDHLRRHAVRPVAVVPGGIADDLARLRADRVGIASVVAEADLAGLPDVVTRPEPGAPADVPGRADPGALPDEPAPGVGEPGRVIAVWGPAGAPGRTTVAVGLAAELADRGRPTVLVDADPYGGSVAQQLAILDEASGLLSAARASAAGGPGTGLGGGIGAYSRRVGERLAVVTGLPRPDRWIEVRARAVEELLAAARSHGTVVVDTGFSLEEDPGGDPTGEIVSRPARNQLTLSALAAADDLVVVGLPDPVGLARLARALVELREVLEGRRQEVRVHVVVNRMRASLGWSEKEVAGMVAGFAQGAGLRFLPDDREGVDAALVSGRTLPELGDSALCRALADLADLVDGRTRVRRRRAGTAHQR